MTMFEPQDKPRLFALPCGVDFPRALVNGLIARSAGLPPEALARAEVIVNTARMQRRVRDLFDAGPTLLLPRLSLLTDLAQRATLHGLPPALPSLRRRLELSQLIAKLLDAQPDLAAISAQVSGELTLLYSAVEWVDRKPTGQLLLLLDARHDAPAALAALHPLADQLEVAGYVTGY